MRDRLQREFPPANRKPRFSEESIEEMRQLLSQRAGRDLTREDAEEGMTQLLGFCRLLADVDRRNKHRAAETAAQAAETAVPPRPGRPVSP